MPRTAAAPCATAGAAAGRPATASRSQPGPGARALQEDRAQEVVAGQRVAVAAEVLDDGHRAEHRATAGDLRDAEAQPALRVEVGDLLAAVTDAALRRQPDAGDDLEQRRLAGAVDAEQRDHLSVVDREV